MPETQPKVDRKEKLKAVERVVHLGRAAIRSGSEKRNAGGPENDAFVTAVQDWKDKSLPDLDTAGLGERWLSFVRDARATRLGLELAIEDLEVLRWRLIQRRAEAIDDEDAAILQVRTWLDVAGSGMIETGLGHGRADYTHEEDRSFGAELRRNVSLAVAWATGKDELLANLIEGLVATIDDRYDNEAPWRLRAVDAWHAGWAMLTIAWLLADVVEDVIPCHGYRLCRFPEAQAVRRTYRQTGAVNCARCGADITPEDGPKTLGATNFDAISSVCESCELVFMFPDQALPESLWNGPFLTLKAKDAAAREEQSDNPSHSTEARGEMETRVEADPKKVFIIHGRNAKARDAMGTFLRACGLTPINFSELRTELGGTATVSAIVSEGMSRAQGIVALFTADEFAALRPEFRERNDKPEDISRWQARPNVIFEAGMAFGKDPNRVVFVLLGNPSLFTDVAGIHVLRPNNDPKGHRATLRDTLRRSMGCVVEDSIDWMTAGDFEECVKGLEEVSPKDPFVDQEDSESPARQAIQVTRAERRVLDQFADFGIGAGECLPYQSFQKDLLPPPVRQNFGMVIDGMEARGIIATGPHGYTLTALGAELLYREELAE